MTQVLNIHPDNPQLRLLRLVADCIRQGGIVAYPTDSAYALGCQIGDKKALERIRQLRELDKNHNFTLLCCDLSEIATYAKVSNPMYRFLKAHTPGAYTFILDATHEVPKRLQHPKRNTIGIRIPDHPVAMGLLGELGEPIMSVTLMLPGSEAPLSDPDEIIEQLEGRVDLIVNAGSCDINPTTIVDLTSGEPTIVRIGKGAIEAFT
jgi:tRNA threonylcarbamoyl adenosine modification protein (Sua5/YciO/YrdC/YwlC family)